MQFRAPYKDVKYIIIFILVAINYCDFYCLRNLGRYILPAANHTLVEVDSNDVRETTEKDAPCSVNVPLYKQKCAVNLALVICRDDRVFNTSSNETAIFHAFGRQISQVVTLLKSVAMAERFSGDLKVTPNARKCVHVRIVANHVAIFENISQIIEEDENWDPEFTQFLEMSYVPAIYPPGYEWMSQIYRPCATIRLFLDNILTDIDSIIYTDTDIIYLRSLQYLWKEFENFSEETVAGLIPEFNNTKFQKRDYNPTAYNTGVMLMNLTRMREIEWSERLGMVSSLYLDGAVYGDQDILVIYFKHFPKQLLDIPCHWNFAPRNCYFGRKCAENGISAVHGLVGSFISKSFEVYFQKFFQVFRETQLNGNFTVKNFVGKLGNTLWAKKEKRSYHNCNNSANFGDLIIKSVQRMEQFEMKFNSGHINYKVFGERIQSKTQTPQISQKGKEEVPQNKIDCTPVALTFCEYPKPKFDERTHILNETVELLKSLVITASSDPNPTCMNVFVIANNIHSFSRLSNAVATWDGMFRKYLRLTYVEAHVDIEYKWMVYIFKRCSSIRLFYPEFLPKVDAVVYVDTDILFFRPVKELWDEFQLFKRKTILAIAPQINDQAEVKNSKLFYRPSKYQGGVMLMNLTRMRDVGFSNRVRMIASFYKEKLKFPNQDILAIYFHYFPDQVALIDCGWNFLPHYCHHLHDYNHPDQILCRSPISVIHGVNHSLSATTFEPTFHKIFRRLQMTKLNKEFSLAQFSLELDLDLIEARIDNIKTGTPTPCGNSGTFGESIISWFNQLLL